MIPSFALVIFMDGRCLFTKYLISNSKAEKESRGHFSSLLDT